jgi:hypothetical protein
MTSQSVAKRAPAENAIYERIGRMYDSMTIAEFIFIYLILIFTQFFGF